MKMFARRRQGGNALVTSLIILVPMSIMGLATMQTSGMDERMASNLRQRSLAFEAAEAALQDAQTLLENNLYGEPVSELMNFVDGPYVDGQRVGDNGLYRGAVYPGVDAAPEPNDCWTDRGSCDDPEDTYLEFPQTFATDCGDGGGIGMCAMPVQPRYRIELMSIGGADGGGDTSVDLSARGRGGTVLMALFRITAYSQGLIDGSRVMLQTFYGVPVR